MIRIRLSYLPRSFFRSIVLDCLQLCLECCLFVLPLFLFTIILSLLGFSDIVVASDDPDAPLALLRQRPWEYDDGSGADILDDEVDLGWVSAGGTRFNKAQVLFATDSGDTATGVVALDWEGDGDVDLAAITPDGGDSGALWVLTNQLDVGPPSTAPSSSPTPLPTPLPTAAPSEQPTESPTSMPSPVPSITPAPTEVPSLEPSPLPSAAPSALPSSSPSSLPSATPTVSPSSSPSSNPTPLPSELPSRLPSSLPSAVPSAPPTQLPTPAPTLDPTPLSEQPSPSPSSLPSAAPTPLPSAAPTGYVTVVKVLARSEFCILLRHFRALLFLLPRSAPH